MGVSIKVQSKLGIVVFILIFFLPVSLGIIINLTDRAQRDYSLENADINILLDPDGSAYIEEVINYRFKGCYKEVYRVPSLSSSPNAPYYLRNIWGYCEPECEIHNRGYEFAGSYDKICDTDVSFHINMDVANAISKGEDLTQFHYKVWGTEWDKPLKRLNSTITFHEKAVITDVFFNPYGIVKDYKIDKNKISFNAENLKDFLEIRVVMTKDSFAFAENHNYTRELVLKEQEIYEKNYILFQNVLMIGFPLVIIFLFVFSYFLYQKHGKELGKISKYYYEREPYEGLKPYQANFIAHSKVGKPIGMVDSDAILATLLDLVRRKHIAIDSTKIPKLPIPFINRFIKNPIQFTFKEVRKDGLSEPEKLVYNFFKGFATNGVLLWNDFEYEIRSTTNAKKLARFAEKFEKEIKKEMEPKNYFDNKGHKIFLGICFLVMALSFVLIGGSLNLLSTELKQLYPYLNYLIPLAATTLVISIIGVLVPNHIFGRFTKKGFDIYKKTLAYKRFITNLTYLKKYPPQSIVIWEEHLIFATALGVADTVSKKLRLVVPDMFESDLSSLGSVYKAGFISRFSSTYSSVTNSSSSSSGGGSFGGGAGGGGGGGGGGAR